MTLKQYKEQNGLTVRELAEELKTVDPRLDAPLVSRMVSGIVEPSVAVRNYVHKKALEGSVGRCNTGEEVKPINVSTFDEKSLETAFLQDLYEELKKASRWAPATRSHLKILLATNDREVRKGIEELRRAGIRVISLSDRRGYWIDKEDYPYIEGDYAIFRHQMLAKAASIYETIRRMDGAVEGQLEWDDIL